MNKFLIISLILILISCALLKKTTYEYNFNGKVGITKNEENQSFRFNLKFDSLLNANIKIFAFAGLKIGEFIIRDSTISVEYVIDEDYKNKIQNEFSEINKKICLRKLLFDLSTKKLNKITNTNSCYSIKANSISGSYDVINRFSEKVFEIQNFEFSSRSSKKNYTISLPETIINLELTDKSEK